MFLMFQLQRPDVLAVGDLGIRRAVERAYGLPDLPSAAELTELAEPWRPYRTAAVPAALALAGQRARLGATSAGTPPHERRHPERGITSPRDPTHEATTPPDNPEPDRTSSRRARRSSTRRRRPLTLIGVADPGGDAVHALRRAVR